MFWETVQTFLVRLKDVFSNFNFFPDILDILFVALLIYAVIVQLRRTKSIQLIKGIILVAIVYAVVSVLNMSASTYLFSRLFNDIILIVVVLFSGEIRQGLEHMGARSFGKKLPFLNRKNEEEELNAINAVCRACGAMSRSKVGSLILFQRETLLGDLTKQAVMIDSEVTFEMLCSIFYPKAPLHDGAVIINNGRIVAARCVVPMTNERVINENVGTRHRAALEASIKSDCVAVVTSEETGMISISVNGNLQRGISDSELRELLGRYLLNGTKEKKNKKDKKQNTPATDKSPEEFAGQSGPAEAVAERRPVEEKPQEVETNDVEA